MNNGLTAALLLLFLALGGVLYFQYQDKDPSESSLVVTEEVQYDPAKVNEQDLADLSTADIKFSRRLYSRVAEQPGNICFSPHSISSLLTLASLGAQGSTRDEILTALSVQNLGPVLYQGSRKLNESIARSTAVSDNVWETASSIWVQDGLRLKQTFMKQASMFFNARPAPVNFQRSPSGATEMINLWVRNQTHERIPELLQPGTITPLTQLVLVNTVYFNGLWESPFDSKRTRQSEFYPNRDTGIPVQMMYQKADFLYAETDEVQVLALPYAGKQSSLLIFLPTGDAPVARVEGRLQEGALDPLVSAMSEEEVKVWLPRFTLNERLDLTTLLNLLGIKQAFTDAADFTGITDEAALQITDIIHQATINVHEAGTEASAATGAAMGITSVRPGKVIEFRADHPFLFILQDDDTGIPLFMGRFSQP